ncbi:MAG: hypothetical protein AABW51_04110 [Nanoarchaeota archaeon]
MVFDGFNFDEGKHRYPVRDGGGGGNPSSDDSPEEKCSKRYLYSMIGVGVAGFIGLTALVLGWVNNNTSSKKIEDNTNNISALNDSTSVLRSNYLDLKREKDSLVGVARNLDSSQRVANDSISRLNSKLYSTNSRVSNLENELAANETRDSSFQISAVRSHERFEQELSKNSAGISVITTNLTSLTKDFNYFRDSLSGKFSSVQDNLYTSVALAVDELGMEHNVRLGYSERGGHAFWRGWQPLPSFTKNGEFTKDGRKKFMQILNDLSLTQPIDSVAMEISYEHAQPGDVVDFIEQKASGINDRNLEISPWRTYDGRKINWTYHKDVVKKAPVDSAKN